MIKRLVYTFCLLIFTPCLSTAKPVCNTPLYFTAPAFKSISVSPPTDAIDTVKTKKQIADDKKKIKEIAKARRQAKPEKLDALPQPLVVIDTAKVKVKPPRQRRPDGLVRPPEIPRRNNN